MTSRGGHKTTVALPLVRGGSLPLAAPGLRDDRYNQLLVELADVLPSRLFCGRDLE